MKDCNWEPIHGFASPGEYKRFCIWLDSQITLNLAEEVPVDLSKSTMAYGFDEKWFKCHLTGVIWRRVSPEVPFLGLWDAV